MKAASFDYIRAKSIDEVCLALNQGDGEAQIIAGGQTLIPLMAMRMARPQTLVDINDIEELRGIEIAEKVARVKAGTRQADVLGSIEIRENLPILSEALGHVGHTQTRNRGTIGGSLANSDPAADYPAAVLGLNATIMTDQREIAADDYFKGLFETALNEDEVLLSVSFPKPDKAAYAKFPNPASRYAVAGVMVARTGDGVRVAVTGAGACAFRATAFEDALNGSFSADALAGLSVDAEDLNSDIHASAAYRAHLVGVMAARAAEEISD